MAIDFFSALPLPGALVPSFSSLAVPISAGGTKMASMPSSGQFGVSGLVATCSLQLVFIGPHFKEQQGGKIYPPSGPDLAPPPRQTF